ncbi:MAG: hypothetical protein LBV19_04720 [Streptococcaceae bacterium]|jgi:hypothetical protein|nr:hypothetical protein [Streptococcaceae bacterium]
MDHKDLVKKVFYLSMRDKIRIQLCEDALSSKIPSEELEAVIVDSLKNGIDSARQIKAQFHEKTIAEIVESHEIKLDYVDMMTQEDFTSIGSFELPNHILINQGLVKKQGTFFQESEINFLTFDYWKEIVLAHEFFHYLQEKDKGMFVNNYQVSVWGKVPFGPKSKLEVLSEIAANAFAQELLELIDYPGLIDMILVFPCYPERMALKLEKALKKIE